MVKAKQKIATMKELSEAIGISRPTLSRYFQDPSTVKPSTSRKIKERLAEVDYVYNFIATRQNRKSSGLIGVIIPHYKDLFFTSLLEAIERAARDAGYTVITQSSNGNATGEAQAVARLRSMSADGAIIAPLGLESSTEAFQLAREDFPIVFTDSRPAVEIQGSDFVGTDNAQSIAAIVDYLCRTGEPPVFLSMPRVNSNAIERQDAYQAKMHELGYEPRFIETGSADESWQFEAYGLGIMDEQFSRQRYTSDTILCANDRIAIGAIRGANKHGLFARNPERRSGLRIAGHDDHPLSQFMFPAITTAAQDIEGIGDVGVRMLLERIRGERDDASIAVLKEAALRIREST
ncbi:LacI family DNA-binding transcriptional regulator [Roseibium album]|uniref:LacI family DNA-binding transcriptional regulator n=1 Tax=Roseibium album TaxID=311410 RepID=UPI00391C5ACA